MRMMVDTPVVGDSQPLNVADRCDGCGAQAYVRVTLASGDLLLCGHHWRKSEDRLVSIALAIRNETDKLLVKP